jgi:hypothetical protein
MLWRGSCSKVATSAPHQRVYKAQTLSVPLLLLLLLCFLAQTRYDALDKGSVVPLSLYDDIVRITKLARVGQADLYDAIRQVRFACVCVQ